MPSVRNAAVLSALLLFGCPKGNDGVGLPGAAGPQGTVGLAGATGSPGMPGVPGAPGIQGPAGSSAPGTLVIVDATGTVVGQNAGVSGASGGLVLRGGLLWNADFTTGTLGETGIAQRYYESIDCTGTTLYLNLAPQSANTLASLSGLGQRGAPGDTVYVASPGANHLIASQWGFFMGPACVALTTPQTMFVAPAIATTMTVPAAFATPLTIR
jgi:hypothetical protein